MEENHISVDLANKKEFSSKTDLLRRLAIDVASAGGSSFLVSPLITIVDRAIIQNTSGVMKMKESIISGVKELIMRPHVFLRRPEYWMVYGVYTSTYSIANSVNSMCEYYEADSEIPRFVGTSIVNIVTCLSKDRAFTRMFGSTVPKSLPLSTYALFTVRDSATIAASFNMPGYFSSYLEDRGVERKKAEVVAQLICPAAVQFVSTPLHLLGLDFYNNPMSTVPSRLALVTEKYTPSVIARICRIAPAFGIGGVGNTAIRRNLRSNMLKSRVFN